MNVLRSISILDAGDLIVTHSSLEGKDEIPPSRIGDKVPVCNLNIVYPMVATADVDAIRASNIGSCSPKSGLQGELTIYDSPRITKL